MTVVDPTHIHTSQGIHRNIEVYYLLLNRDDIRTQIQHYSKSGVRWEGQRDTEGSQQLGSDFFGAPEAL